jgi:4-amino-4-deoxy-L-arabinose transferase-like glycosyltransferase
VTSRAVELEPSLPSSTTWISRTSISSTCLLIFCAAFLSYAYTTRGLLDWMGIPSGAETLQVARALATTGRYADPFGSIQAHSGYTAHLAPVYPAILALMFRGIGYGLASLTVLWVANLVFIAVQMALLPLLSSRLGLGTLPGIIGAAFGILLPQYTVDFVWESLLVGMELVLLCLFTRRILGVRHSWWRASLLGILWGVAILTNPVTVLVLAVWVLASVLWQRPGERRSTIASCAIIIAAAAVVCAPWIVRNKARLGGFFLIRDNLGLELSVSNNDCASATLLGNLESGCQRIVHPSRNYEITEQISKMGEYRFNEKQLHQALVWITQHPKRFALLTAQRFVLFWFPVKGLAPFRRFPPVVWVTTLFSFFGLVRLCNRNWQAVWCLGGTMLVYPLVYYVVQFEPRYRDPIMWISLLLAGYGMTELLTRTALFRRLQQQAAV